MKIILVLFLLSLSLVAKNDNSCYSVEIFKKDYTQKNIALAHNNHYPASCKRMKLGGNIAVRCGCYDEKQKALANLEVLKKSYKDATLSLTYKHRFQKKSKRAKTSVKKNTKKVNVKPACYSVEILHEKYNKKNLALISKMKLPSLCKKMKLGSSLAVRCGCYEKKSSLEKLLVEYKKKYPQAKKTLTYAYRFKHKAKKTLKPLASKETCYSVELLKRRDNIQSINELSERTFPESCVLMNIRGLLALRCGCYKTKKEVIDNYRILKKKYKNAHITQSYVSKYNGD